MHSCSDKEGTLITASRILSLYNLAIVPPVDAFKVVTDSNNTSIY